MKPIATVETTKYILNKYNLHAKKKFGQNFLVDANLIDKICLEANINGNTAVIEIGPGIGALTEGLIKYSGKVICYEIDEQLKLVHDEFFPNTDIFYEDILKSNVRDLIIDLKKQYEEVIIVSNLPYYITTKIIEKFLRLEISVDRLIIMLQDEVAQKFTGDNPSPLNLLIQARGYSEYLFKVSQHVFIPKPRVESAVIEIVIDSDYNANLDKLIKDSFKQKRKTIYNNLKHYKNIGEVLDRLEIARTTRAEQITLEGFQMILAELGNEDEN